MKDIGALSDHHIVCGLGRMGRVIVSELEHDNAPYVVIEQDAARINAVLQDHPKMVYVQADATKEHSLELARIIQARGLACCLPDDGDNLLVCLTVRGMKPDMNIVARAVDEESVNKLRRAGATHVVSAIATGAVRMASALVRPSIMTFLDAATVGAGINMRLEEVLVSTGSKLAGQSLAEAKISQTVGLIVLGLKRDDSEPIIYNPGPDAVLNSGDGLIVLGSEEQVGRLRQYVAGDLAP